MGILSNIFHKIFPPSHPAGNQGASQSAAQGSMQSASAQPAGQASSSAPPPAAPLGQIDVEAILDNMVTASGQSLNWRSSIVDLLKLLQLDSGLEARKELARELNYKGDTSDTAALNIWLHRQLMYTLAANGGKVPAELKH
ncbi:MAG: DUF3597 domain-containing protein [Pseudomonadota bacterium]